MQLEIEPGALVCGSPGAELRLRVGGALTAMGTADLAIVFTAQDPERPWTGLLLWGNAVTLAHVVVEHATTGAWTNPEGLAGTVGPVEIRNSRFRALQGTALKVGYRSTVSLIESEVDSVCLGVSGCAAISAVGRGPALRFEDTVIRHSGGMGIYAETVGSGPAAHLTFVGGSIEGSAGVGLVTAGHSLSFEVVTPVRITGSGSYPARVHLPLAAAQLATPAGHEGWLGNARDTVILHGGLFRQHSATVRPGLVWSIDRFDGSIDRFVLEPGAAVHLTGNLVVGQILAAGIPDAPIEIIGGHLRVANGEDAPSQITHTRLAEVDFSGRTPGLVMEDIVSDGGSVSLDAPGARLTRSRLRGAALWIRAANIEVASCEVTDNGDAGIRVVEAAEGVRVRECNIHGNVGPGLRSTAHGTVDARNNWWGDPEGPEGPSGDGVEGDVLFEPWRSEPWPLHQESKSTWFDLRTLGLRAR